MLLVVLEEALDDEEDVLVVDKVASKAPKDTVSTETFVAVVNKGSRKYGSV